MMIALPDRQLPPCPAPRLPLEPVLDKLRVIAGRCRCTARLDVFQACDLIDPDDTRAADCFATALVRTLPQCLNHYPQLRGPGAPASFDETWLLQLLDCAKRGDDDSLRFLILRRVPAIYRHRFLFLINGLAKRIEAL